MSKICIILGDSGSGKTASLRNLPEGSAVVMSATGKELSFVNKNKLPLAKVGYDELMKAIPIIKQPIVIIDDANYLMTFENMARSKELGYGKFTEMAIHFFNIFDAISKKDSDQVFYIMSHAEVSELSGQRQVKTIGKMLSEKIVLEGLSNIVLESTYDELDGYTFTTTRTDATSAAKAPMQMFSEKQVPNDLFEIDKIIRKFYNFEPIKESK